MIWVYYTLLYISISKLKPKLMALNSIHFSFNRNIKIGNRMSFPPKYILKSYTFCKKSEQNERKVRRNH